MTLAIATYGVLFVLALACGLGVVLARKPVHSLVCLVGVMVALAAIFLMAHCEVLAVIQILVYAGAIVVLFLFVIMMLDMREPERDARAVVARPWLAALLGLVFIAIAIGGVNHALSLDDEVPLKANEKVAFDRVHGAADDVIDESQNATLRAIGRLTLTRYLLPFELVSVLLLLAIVGVVALTSLGEPAPEEDGE